MTWACLPETLCDRRFKELFTERMKRMDKIYKNCSGKICPEVTVSVIRSCWTAKSDSQDCEKDVNDILQGMKYNGEGDVEKIIDMMQSNGFTSPIRPNSRRHVPVPNQVPTKEIIFDHVATSAAVS
jgi:hypothetical protein